MSAKIRFISAGAGSGKTHRLTQILGEELASNRARPRGVIATTFTRKAAAELRERVRAHLISEGSVARAHEMGQARIGTVNAVCGELLERFAFEAGMPTELRVLEEESAKAYLARAMDAALEGPRLSELLSVAGRLGLAEKSFGSDEIPWRAALQSLVAQARSNGIDEARLKGFGPTNADNLLSHFGKPTKDDVDAKLAAALQSAIQGLTKAQSARKNTGDYLALLLKAERDHLSRDLAWSVWAKLADEDTGPEKGLFEHAEPVQAAAGAFAQHPRFHHDIRRYLELIFDVAADTLATYAAIKKEIGGIDFVDQEQQLLQVLDLPPVREVIAEELDLLMVDEFQDTSPIQLALFTRLAECARQVVWVGDVKQAIYGFRGSDSELMTAVIDSLPRSGVVPEVLSRSWRSRPSLVHFVNAVFGDTFPGLDRKMVELEPQRKDYEGAPAVIDWLVEGKNQELQVRGIAAGVAQLVAEGTLACDKGSDVPRPARYADVAVLARSNATVLAIAAALTDRGVPCSTSQPGLCGKAEVVLALACLRRLVDEYDTLATAEIVSLADCAEPEAWIAERLAWLEQGLPPQEWKVVAKDGFAAHPILATLAGLTGQVSVLSPREAVEAVITRCGLATRVLQWQRDEGRARLRLANLDRLLELAAEYESEMRTGHGPATLSGFILWLGELGESGQDELPEPAIDAVRVMTHHAAKGLEWPIVVACDLAKDIRERLWSVQAESAGPIDVANPLEGRFIHYWPWPFGARKKVEVADRITVSPKGFSSRKASEDEDRRLLYVSFTRARDVLVLARTGKTPVGEWMETVGLSKWLGQVVDGKLPLRRGGSVPYRSSILGEDAGPPAGQTGAAQELVWFEGSETHAQRLPLRISPSSSTAVDAVIAEIVDVCDAIDTSRVKDRAKLGDAVHACIAAQLSSRGTGLNVGDTASILARLGLGEVVDPAALHRQIVAVSAWVRGRWPGCKPIVEIAVQQVTAEGQVVGGRMDLLLQTQEGWILIDYKSAASHAVVTGDKLGHYGAQLALYSSAVSTATKTSANATWVAMPIAGKALRIETTTQVTDSQ